MYIEGLKRTLERAEGLPVTTDLLLTTISPYERLLTPDTLRTYIVYLRRTIRGGKLEIRLHKALGVKAYSLNEKRRF